MKQIVLLISILCIVGFLHAQTTMDVGTDDGMLNEVIGADTLGDGTQAHDIYQLVSLDKTYKFTGPINAKGDISIVGVLGEDDRPPCIQPAVLEDQSIPPTILIVSGENAQVSVKNLYLLAYAPNNAANNDGIAISVSADNVRLTVDNCVFDGWQAFGIGYNGNWDDFFISNSHFRNFVHPNQHYVGEVIRNTWPGEAYTDTMSFVGNTMLCVNGYAAAPVTKYYQTYFEFIDNKVLYTFKNPFFIFNVTDAKINDNIFYANYAGGVDTLENPWWDNLWFGDTTYGVIALQPLNGANAVMFQPDDSANAEGLRTVEVMNNSYYWPSTLTNYWDTWNNSQPNKIITPTFMNERTVEMFANDTDYPFLTESNNVNVDPGFMASIDPDVLNGTVEDGTVGFLAYFEQIRTGVAATDYWGYALTWVTGEENWVPVWPLPENSHITSISETYTDVRPQNFNLKQNYPNPFNPTTMISYDLQKASNVTLTVFNVTGQKVETLVNDFKPAGTYNIEYDASTLASGVYYYELEAGAFKQVRKMLLVK